MYLLFDFCANPVLAPTKAFQFVSSRLCATIFSWFMSPNYNAVNAANTLREVGVIIVVTRSDLMQSEHDISRARSFQHEDGRPHVKNSV